MGILFASDLEVSPSMRLWTLGPLLIVCVGTLVPPTPPVSAATFHVAPAHPRASDDNPGTERRPWRTIGRAQDAVRQLTAKGLREDVVVTLHDGVYRLQEPLRFGPQDGGDQKHSVTYLAPGGKAVLSGGKAVAGWRPTDGPLWIASLPVPPGSDWWPSLLVVDGVPAVRARTPNANADAPMVAIADSQLDVPAGVLRLTFPDGFLTPCDDAGDLELVTQGNWAINRMRVRALEADRDTVTVMKPADDPARLPWHWPGKGRWCFLENAREWLDQPGEWYLDRRAGKLYYWPLPGQDMRRAVGYLPRLPLLLSVSGTEESPVRNLHFRGLRFAHADWPLPAGDYHGVQACYYATDGATKWLTVPAALRFECAEGCSLAEGAVVHCSGCGVKLDRRCYDNICEGLEIVDIGGNGLMVGAENKAPEAPRRNRLANNVVSRCGSRFYGAVGIWIGFASHTQVAHNLVYDLPYSGISCGWVWAPQLSECRENVLEYNHIHHVMQKLCDGGGIYTLGWQPGTVIRGNCIHDIYRSPYAQGAPNNGLFIDEGSKEFLLEENVVYAVEAEPVRHNQNSADWHTWRHNHFGLRAYVPGRFGRALSCPASFLEVPHRPELEPGELTVEAWIKVPTFDIGGDQRRWIVNKNDDEWVNGHYALCLARDRAGAYLNIGGGQENTIAAFSPRGVLTAGRWHHLAMTYDGQTLRTFADGRQVAEAVAGRPRQPGSLPLAIGRRQDAYNTFFGLIDEVRIFDRALSPAEVAEHYQAGASDPPQSPTDDSLRGQIAFFSFEDASEDVAVLTRAMQYAGPREPYRSRFAVRHGAALDPVHGGE